MELCGKYALTSEADRGFVSRDQALSSVENMAQFLGSMGGWFGIPKANAILKYVGNGSRSPMETRQWLLMCLPRRLGGYGIPRPAMNARIELNSEERYRCRRNYLECDMYWADMHVVVEYDGHDDHESRIDRSNDAVKRNTLIARGNTVFTVTGKQICDAEAFDAVVRDIAHSIGYRLKGFPDDWTMRRSLLRKELFKSLSVYEKERFF